MDKRLILAVALVNVGVALADGPAQPSYDELLKRLDALQAKVDSLESKQRNYVSAADVDATVKRVMADADRRSQLFSPEQTLHAGYKDGKLLIQTADGNFLFHPYAQFQVRQVTTLLEDASGSSDNWQNGFEIRRMKFGVDGNVFTKDLSYAFQMAFDRNGGTPNLEDAWAKYRFLPEWTVIGGQFKDPLAHESLVSSKYFLALERSLVNDVFANGDNYIQGVGVTWDNQDNCRVSGAFHDGANVYPGINGFNNNFQDFPNPNGSKFAGDFGGAGRFEYKAFGDWKNYNDFGNLGLKKDLLVFGAAADFTQAGGTSVITETADVNYKMTNGWSLYFAGYADQVSNSPVSASAVATHNVYNWGALAQVGYMFAPKWEAYGRYDFIYFGDNSALLGSSTQQNVQEISLGVNYYIHGQAAKFTLDVTYLPEGSPVSDSGAGILIDDGHAEFIAAAQFQLLL